MRSREAHPHDRILCLVIDRGAARADLVERVAAAVAAGVDWVQIRDRALGGAALLAHAEAVSRAARRAAETRGGRVAIFVNRRIDIALAIGADGVQLGFDALDPAAARRLLAIADRTDPGAAHALGDAFALRRDRSGRAASGASTAAGGWIGISAHRPDEIRAAPPEVDFAQLAPIFPPISKPTARPSLGVRAIAEAARCEIPVIAQGGICARNAAEVAAAGAAGIAVTGAILSARDLARETRALRAALDAAPHVERANIRPAPGV